MITIIAAIFINDFYPLRAIGGGYNKNLMR